MKNSLRSNGNLSTNLTEISIFISTMENPEELRALQSVMTEKLLELFPDTKTIRIEDIQERTPLGIRRNKRLFYQVNFPVEAPED